MPFPEPTGPPVPRAEVLLGDLDHFRSLVVTKVQWVLFHLVQELYARHAGHLDVVRELIDGRAGE